MGKVIFAGLAVAIVGSALVAPTEAGTMVMQFMKPKVEMQVGDAVLAKQDRPVCGIRTSWKYDYAGKPYLRKVRVCA